MKKKPDYWYSQSALIPFRCNENSCEILLIRSRKNKKWIIPKGIIEPKLSPGDSAKKEAYEEAGIEGEMIEGKTWEYTYRKWDGQCNVRVFLLKVTAELKTWPENFRKRKWFSIEKAINKIENDHLKLILENASEAMK